MLSRVAEYLYWMARYIERAENTARLINVNSHLQLDLPKQVRPGWMPLIEITGGQELFGKLYETLDERSVIKFLIGESKNSSSILSSLQQARENARTIRDIIPREAWEQINELYLNVKEQLASGLSQKRRFSYLKMVILGTQQITGLLAGTMSHDAGYFFVRMGRNLERADMTTRIIDVRSANLLPEQADYLKPYENIQWMGVLKSLTAYQMYRRHMQVAVRRSEVLTFLLKNIKFPRAFYHCLVEVQDCLLHLPHNDLPLRTLAKLQRIVNGVDTHRLKPSELHELIDLLQLSLGELHDLIYSTYFSRETDTASKTKFMAEQKQVFN